LERIVAHAVDLLEGCEAAGIMVVRKGTVSTLAGTDDMARTSDRIQGQLRQGPCFDSANDKNTYRIADLTAAEGRWSRYVPPARELGIGSMMGFLLYTDGQDDLGALNLYSLRPSAFTEQPERLGWMLASHAVVALSSARHAEHMGPRAEHLAHDRRGDRHRDGPPHDHRTRGLHTPQTPRLI
jgi:hypothetical protein